MADFQKNLPRLRELGVKVVALSVDSEEDARATVDRYKVTFPVVYGLDVEQIVALTGAYYEREKGFLHATAFILRNGSIVQSTYSSGPLGRLQAQNVVMLVDYYKKQEK